MIAEIQEFAPVIAVISLFVCFGYVAYIQRSGTVMASAVIWKQEIADAGDLLRNTFDIGKKVPGAGFEKMLATPPLYLRADQGSLCFEMHVVKYGMETHINSNDSNTKIAFAGFSLEQNSDKGEIFNIPPTIINAAVSKPNGIASRKYIYTITKGTLIKSGEYTMKAFLPYNLLGQIGTEIKLCVISGRLPIDLRIVGGLISIFLASICTLFFTQTQIH